MTEDGTYQQGENYVPKELSFGKKAVLRRSAHRCHAHPEIFINPLKKKAPHGAFFRFPRHMINGSLFLSHSCS